MEYKTRRKSRALKIFKLLAARMPLTDADNQYYANLQKGHEGEERFDSLIQSLECDYLLLNDLLLKFNNTTFQIDSLLICSDAIHLFEVKNYEGDFYYDSDKLYTKSNTEIMNPLIQLTRTESLLRQLLQHLKLSLPINSYVVFINPEFTLYQAPRNTSFIFPTQLNRFLKQLTISAGALTTKHKQLAEKLASLHMDDFPFQQLPSYEYEQLRKGIVCRECGSFQVTIVGKNCVCRNCGERELVSDSILRGVDEFKLLFPTSKITTKNIYNWCSIIDSKRRISRTLEKNFTKVSSKRWTYFE
ncbi:nuclease-related domain-containing protein [Ornithinibacillus contaminans]|uniref:nuclease-related domain-containing protein n=1 Tax=Ornithinibacillus contaminans TaxID=694055 RepID=UPI00064DC173|nr:nuclease-related domain-containing protein [Ornithinibacillus contaminans]